MAIRSSNKILPSFSMSSMTDLVFLLLIFFMITSTLVNPNALKLLLPQSNNQTQSQVATTVSIDRNLNYFIDGNIQAVSLADLERQLQLRLMDVSEPTISLHVDRTITMEEAVKVINIAAYNRWRMILATSPESRR